MEVIATTNGMTTGLRREPELISTKSLSIIIDVPEKTLRDWVHKAKKNPSPNSIPYYKLPTGGIRFKLSEIRIWYGRGRSNIS